MEERRLREIEREKREQAELANAKQENGKRANSSARNTSTERRNGVAVSETFNRIRYTFLLRN